MMWRLAMLLLLAAAAADVAAGWQVDHFMSSDADGNDVDRAALTYDWHRAGIDERTGIALERARFSGDGWAHADERVYLRMADSLAGPWRWQANVGTDRHSLVGNGSLYTDEAFRKEIFVERELLETRQGVERRLYHSFVGAAVDIPLTHRLSTTVLGGLQQFSGDNLRRHARTTLTATLVEDWGLSAQLRLRHFADSDPREFDYFAPGWYWQAVGGVSMRRVVGGYSGRVVLAAGRQRAADGDSTAARLVELQFETPKRNAWYLKFSAGYSNAPITASYTYDYRYARLELVHGL